MTSDSIDPVLEGCMLRCNSCGTEWLAREYVDNPYSGNGFQGPMVRPPVGNEGPLIDHTSPEFDSGGSESVGSRAPRRVGPGWTRGRITTAVLAALAAVMMAKVPIVAALPEGGKIASVPAGNDLLRFDRVRGEHDTLNGANHLVIAGDVVNPTRTTLALPSVRIALRTAEGEEIRSWRLDLAKPAIEAGETIRFRSAVAGTAKLASEVKLTMVPRRDRKAALR